MTHPCGARPCVTHRPAPRPKSGSRRRGCGRAPSRAVQTLSAPRSRHRCWHTCSTGLGAPASSALPSGSPGSWCVRSRPCMQLGGRACGREQRGGGRMERGRERKRERDTTHHTHTHTERESVCVNEMTFGDFGVVIGCRPSMAWHPHTANALNVALLCRVPRRCVRHGGGGASTVHRERMAVLLSITHHIQRRCSPLGHGRWCTLQIYGKKTRKTQSKCCGVPVATLCCFKAPGCVRQLRHHWPIIDSSFTSLDIVWTISRAFLSSNPTHNAPCATLSSVPMLIGRLVGAWNPML